MSKLDRKVRLSDTQHMRLHRFFVNEFFEHPLENPPQGEVFISESDLIHQWKDVFRLKAGDRVILLDNTGREFTAQISELHKKGALLQILKIESVKNIPKINISLFCSLIKKDNFEWILEKGTELGVNSFTPLVSERSEKKSLNIDRAQKIIQEASEQSGRGIIPQLREIESLENIINTTSLQLIAFDPTGMKFNKENFGKHELGILVGPEGGWSNHELEVFNKNNISIYSLGSQILRAETAAIAISALFLL